jgi:hypothetical protein
MLNKKSFSAEEQKWPSLGCGQNMIRYFNIFVACFVLLSSTMAEGQDKPADAPTLESLQREVQQLQEQLSILQAQLAAQPISVPPPAPPESATVALAGTATRERPHINIRGFGEVNYQALDLRQPEIAGGGFVPGSAANFYTGDFDLLLTAPLSERLNVLSEINFEETDAQHFEVDVERFLLNYDCKDWLRFSAGRYQTAIGYYNTVFMSGAWPQTMADRPLIMAFSDVGGVMPVQAIGVSLKGAIPSGKLGLNYLFEYGSSDTMRTRLDGTESIDDENNGNQVNVGIFLRPDWIPGLEVGGSFYHDNISDDRNLSVRYGQSILNAHIVYVARGLEFLNEGVLIRHAQTGGPNLFNMPGAYTQISKEFGHVRPFFRFQYVNTNPRSALHDVRLRYGPSFGARYDFNTNVAFKLQFDHTERQPQPGLNGIQTEISFAF